MAEKTGVSFSFTKTKEAVVLKESVIRDSEIIKEDDTEYFTSLTENEIQSTRPKEKKKELVIPLISKNKWKNPKRPEDLDCEEDPVPEKKRKKENETVSNEATDDVETAAVNELLREAAIESGKWNERGSEVKSDLAVPLLMQNKVPEGFETDERLNVELRPDEPAEADYDEVPIEEYGMALLRGMGFNEKQGVGKNSKVFKPVEAVARPKGLGLGADKSKALQAKHGATHSGDRNEEELVLKKGAFAVVTSGKNADLYGEVQGTDEDNNRVMLKMTLSGEIISISQNAIQLVSKSEYTKYSKYINKGKSDRYKETEKSKSKHKSDSDKSKKHKHRSRSRERDSDSHRERGSDSHRQRDSDSHREHDSDSYRDSDRKHKSKHKHKSKTERDRHVENGHSESSSSGRKHLRPEDIWLRSHLRVRIIDPNFKKGKYFKSKVVIEDVVSFDNCVVRTEDGKILEDLSQNQLETVIPRSEPGYVMLLSGKYKAKVAEILRKDKSACLATVQLLSDRDIVTETHYDTICEYTGDVSTELDF